MQKEKANHFVSAITDVGASSCRHVTFNTKQLIAWARGWGWNQCPITRLFQCLHFNELPAWLCPYNFPSLIVTWNQFCLKQQWTEVQLPKMAARRFFRMTLSCHLFLHKPKAIPKLLWHYLGLDSSDSTASCPFQLLVRQIVPKRL